MGKDPAGEMPQGPRARRFIRLGPLCEKTTLSSSTIYDKMAEGSFPKPVKLFDGPPGKKSAVAWVEEEIDAWMDARVAARDAAPAPKKAKPVEELAIEKPEPVLEDPQKVLRELKRKVHGKRLPKPARRDEERRAAPAPA